MDWTAVGAIGTVAAAIIAFFEWRHRKREHDSNLSIYEQVPPAQVSALMLKSKLSFPFPEGWKADPYDAGTPQAAAQVGLQRKIEAELSNFEVAQIIITNHSKNTLKNLDVVISCSGVWSFRVEDVHHLAESSVALSYDGDFFRIKMESMPPGERAVVSIVGRYISTIPKAGNAGLEIKLLRWWDV